MSSSSSVLEFPVGFREVVPNQTLPEKCKEFVINTGGSQSTLQDIKLPDCAGGYSYSNRPSPRSGNNDGCAGGGGGGGSSSRNRFISWRTSRDVLELVETSLDWNLIGNKVRYKFQDTPLLEGLTIHETFNAVVVLVATVSSVHKMIFPHPDRIHNREFFGSQSQESTSIGIPSIFAEATPTTAKEYSHLIPHIGTTPMPHTAASWLTHDEEAIFVLANPAGNITAVKLGNMRGIVSVNPLKSASYLGRIWGSIGGMLARTNDGSDSVMSLCISHVNDDYFVFGVCKDHKIRMWSTSSYECVLVADVLQHTAEDSRNLVQGAQNHILRKVMSSDQGAACGGGSMALAVFLCFSQHSQFCVFKPQCNSGQFELQHLATIYAPEYDLVDFSVTPTHLWALWTNSDGESFMRYASFGATASSERGGGWSAVVLEDPLSPVQYTQERYLDPRQFYLQLLFHPGRFSIETLTKTVSIYRRCMDSALNPENENISITRLREDICVAVEAEIQNQVTHYEVLDEDYVAISSAAWSKFYSTAIQYHQVGLKPMGLICDSQSGLVAIIKKNNYSFLRPVDALEHLVLSKGIGNSPEELFHDTAVLCEDIALAMDVINLMKAVALVSAFVTEDMASEFSQKLSLLVSPEKVAQVCATEILSGDSESVERANLDFTQELSTRLQQVNDVVKALEVLITILGLDRGIVSHSAENEISNENKYSRIFASTVGISVVSESLHQMALTRFDLTRDIIILQLLMLNCGTAVGVSTHALELIHSTYLPRSVVMVHCYFILYWLTERTVTAPPPNSLEQGLRQMAILKISSAGHSSPTAAQLSRISASRPLTLSELFLTGPGAKARSLLTSDVAGAPWHSILMPLVNISAQLLWPKCAVPIFQEFLLSACQYMQIQEYVRLLSTWCDWNSYSRQFLLGSALLNMGEPEKACDWMIQASGGVTSDQFLYSQLFGGEPNEVDPERMTVLYFLKVIQLFEQSGYSDFVISLAETAMSFCEQDDPDRATLCYILFSYHLRLGHNDDAYDAMIANPDKTRRKDSLRQFIVTLFDRRQLRQLASYPYVDMFEDLEAIIESRARSVDLTVNNYYDFLYSFHVMKENYRKAAHVMYECGMRLGTEVVTKEGLKSQAQCYLACLNALKLVNKNYAWIVKPVPMGSISSPKHSLDGEEVMEEGIEGFKNKMEVVEMDQIQKEFELVCARLKLVNKSSSPSIDSLAGPSLSPSEIVSILIASNFFEDAIKISELYSLDYRPIVEGLTSRCVRLTQCRSSVEADAAWDWIAENNPSSSDIRNGSSVEAAWKFLEDVLHRLEAKGQSVLHKAVVTRLFSLGSYLPNWIIASYKIRNPSELLRLYLCHGYLEDAGNLASSYISAVLGNGKEYFGLGSTLHAAASAPVWLPYTALDQLLLELRDHANDDSNEDASIYRKLYAEVNGKVEDYILTVNRVSQDMLHIKANP